MQQNSIETRQLEALLDFYLEAGVDSFPGDDRVDWFELTRQQAALRQQGQEPRTAAQAPSGPDTGSADARDTRHSQFAPPVKTIPAQPIAPSSGQPAVIPDKEIVGAARDLAATAATLDDLRSCLEAFDGCNLKLTAKKLVFADGNPDARLMFVGEAPGRDEDFQGKPFVGRSGQLLDSMLTAIGLDRSSAYIANVVPWRPPGNRTPTPQETEICKPFIQRQIELVNPDVLVFLGAASAKTLLGVQDGIRKMRGRWMQYPGNGKQIAAIATYHPAYLLRSPLEKRLSWRDFLSIREKLTSQ
ncbi:MAG: uracil-DNA glycosylase [Roseibium sp.]|nr:uracil-DNA glycosylase [Roseibium sp.]